MADEPKYKRLTRARPRARFAIISTGNSSVWLGPDHLLCIDSNGYTENYKRFYFRDIQAFIARKTDGYKYASLVLGLIGVFLGIIAVITSDSVGRIILFSAAGLFLLCMSLNLLFGPTTLCYLQTAVQVEFLPSIRRLRKARKILNLIRPLIASAQGEVAPEEIARRFSGMPGMPAQVAQQPAVTGVPPVINLVPPTASDSVDARYMPPQNLS
jgi:hypothetical protein